MYTENKKYIDPFCYNRTSCFWEGVDTYYFTNITKKSGCQKWAQQEFTCSVTCSTRKNCGRVRVKQSGIVRSDVALPKFM